jgi:hypothetical protein
MNVEALTDATAGTCEYVIEGAGTYSLGVSREGYVSYTKELGITKNGLRAIVVPVIPIVEETGIRIMLSGDAGCEGTSLCLYCPKGIPIAHDRLVDEDVVNAQNKSSPQNGVKFENDAAATVGVMATITGGVNDWYRICVAVTDPKFTTLDKTRLDKSQRNEMQTANMVLQVILNNQTKYTIYPPAFPSGPLWDVGYLNGVTGEMMLVNCFCPKTPASRLELFDEYLAFYGYLNRKSNLRTLFGTSDPYLQASTRRANASSTIPSWTDPPSASSSPRPSSSPPPQRCF